MWWWESFSRHTNHMRTKAMPNQYETAQCYTNGIPYKFDNAREIVSDSINEKFRILNVTTFCYCTPIKTAHIYWFGCRQHIHHFYWPIVIAAIVPIVDNEEKFCIRAESIGVGATLREIDGEIFIGTTEDTQNNGYKLTIYSHTHIHRHTNTDE